MTQTASTQARRFLIDTDTASDDAVALVLALTHPGVQIEAITVVSGNVPLDQGVQNALYTVQLCGRADVPVHRGLAKPILRDVQTAQVVHGQDGMGDIGLPLAGREPAAGHAVDVILDTFRGAKGEIDLITLGPLSNIAVALLREPDLARWVRRCYMMGGTGDNVGNACFAGEYNLWADPEAAKIVFESGMAITMVGWDISRTFAVLEPEDQAEIRAIGTPLAEFVIDIQKALVDFCRETTHLAGIDMPDPITVAIALDESIATAGIDKFVTVECSDGHARGMSVIDFHAVSGRAQNTHVVTEANRDKFIGMLTNAVSKEA